MNFSTLQNLDRKKTTINTVTLLDDNPIPSFIDINITELCNRKCVFCPRHDDALYPNQKLYMDIATAEAISRQLVIIGFTGIINICGYGEPLLHPLIEEIIAALNVHHVEIVTNGDFLTKQKIISLHASGCQQMIVSLYDGPHQTEKFAALFGESGLDQKFYSLRDRWYSKNDGYGVILTNRAGVLATDSINQYVDKPCFYPHYSMTIDWNGDVLLCVQDWNKLIRFGNVRQTSMGTYSLKPPKNTSSSSSIDPKSQPIYQIWTSEAFNKYRSALMTCRSLEPCKKCDCNGTIYGKDHAIAWSNNQQ